MYRALPRATTFATTTPKVTARTKCLRISTSLLYSASRNKAIFKMPHDDNLDRQHTIAAIQNSATTFPSVKEAGDAIAKSFNSFGQSSKVLLIGDASHGTSQFYEMRAEITKYMIENHGFDIVAVEADWPDAETIDRYVRHRPFPGGQPDKLDEDGRESAFSRFPTWMWRNLEVQQFVEWLRTWNQDKEEHDAVGFYGLDLYSMGTSMQAVIDYLEQVDKEMAQIARDRYSPLMVWAEEPHEYGLEALATGFKGYEKQVVNMLRDMLSHRLEYSSALSNGIEFHSGEQNARLVKDAEHYYKAMYYAQDKSWNIRDTHMFDTLVRIIKHRGARSKAIVWAHNSHVGDARATSMGWSQGELNIGQLCKQTFGPLRALSIGCSSHTGTVAASSRWDGDMRIMSVRPSLPTSYERLLHDTGLSNFIIDLRKGECEEGLRQALRKPRIERFIGVIYRPDTERHSHYSSAILPDQFDGVVWMDETKHVGALEGHQPETALEFGETWPFGL